MLLSGLKTGYRLCGFVPPRSVGQLINYQWPCMTTDGRTQATIILLRPLAQECQNRLAVAHLEVGPLHYHILWGSRTPTAIFNAWSWKTHNKFTLFVWLWWNIEFMLVNIFSPRSIICIKFCEFSLNKSNVTRQNTIGCLDQYMCRGLRLWNSQGCEVVLADR